MLKMDIILSLALVFLQLVYVGGFSSTGAIVSRMASTWKEKDPAQDADPELLKKARENPKGIFVSLFRQVYIVKINVVFVLPSIQEIVLKLGCVAWISVNCKRNVQIFLEHAQCTHINYIYILYIYIHIYT